MPDGKPLRSGVQINIHPRIAGCGCFMLSALAMLVGCGLLLIIVWGFLIPDWRTNNSYLQASAIVLDKRLVANDSADDMFCEAVCLIAGPLSEVAMHCRDRPTLIRV